MLFVDAGNNRVGIGTAAPLTTMHISASAATEAVLTIQGQADAGIRLAADKANGDEGNNPYIDWYQDGQNPTSRNNRLATISLEGDAGTAFTGSLGNSLFIDTFCPNAQNSNGRPFQIATDSSRNNHGARITIEGVRGNVGLHTATPAESLHLSGAIRIDSQGRENLLVVTGTLGDDSHQMLVMSTTSDGYGDDTNFYVSGTIGSRGTSVKGTSVFGGDTVVSGNLHAAEYIYHLADADTSMRFEADQITFAAGGENLLTITEASQDIVTVGDGGDVDFKVRTNNNDNTLFVQGNTDRVGIGLNGPATTLHLKDSDVTIRLQRNDNAEAGTIEFAGSGGALGASIAHDVVGNDLVFDVFDGSGLEEAIRLGGYGSGTNRQVIILSGNTMHDGAMQPRQAADIAFFVSGAVGSAKTALKGAAAFGGDLVVSGAVIAPAGISGSITRLSDGTSYLAAGTNVTITSASNGQVTITSSGGSTSPGGANTQIQFNDGGSFGGDAGLLYNKTSNSLYAEGVITGALGFSGSLTRLVDGTSYLAAGANVTITSASNGQVVIASTDSNTEYTAGNRTYSCQYRI